MSVLEVLDKGRIVFFISEEEEVEYRDLFPSTLLITPELLPSSDESRNVDNLVQDVLMMVKRGSLSVNLSGISSESPQTDLMMKKSMMRLRKSSTTC